jgi:hypothetical protein
VQRLRIEKRLGADANISITDNTATGWGYRYVDVEADQAGVIKGAIENAAPRAATGGKTKVDEIARWLRGRYPTRPALSTPELLRVVQVEGQSTLGRTSPRSLERAMVKAWR